MSCKCICLFRIEDSFYIHMYVILSSDIHSCTAMLQYVSV